MEKDAAVMNITSVYLEVQQQLVKICRPKVLGQLTPYQSSSLSQPQEQLASE